MACITFQRNKKRQKSRSTENSVCRKRAHSDISWIGDKTGFLERAV